MSKQRAGGGIEEGCADSQDLFIRNETEEDTAIVVLFVKNHQNIQTEEEGEKEMGRETERGGETMQG